VLKCGRLALCSAGLPLISPRLQKSESPRSAGQKLLTGRFQLYRLTKPRFAKLWKLLVSLSSRIAAAAAKAYAFGNRKERPVENLPVALSNIGWDPRTSAG
jgi:hypothetical protein